MREGTATGPFHGLLIVTAMGFLCSCAVPFEWNAEVRTTVDDALTVVALTELVARYDGVQTAVIPSGREITLVATLINPRSILVSGTVDASDETQFEVLPRVVAENYEELRVYFTPALAAEHTDITVRVAPTAPALNRTYDPAELVLRCNSAPGCVTDSLDAALDEAGRPFAAFRLPCSATDDDLDRVEIVWTRADAGTVEGTVTLPVLDHTLLGEIRTCDGGLLLEPGDLLNRSFRPAATSTGDDYLFTVVLIDTEGLRSTPATITTNAATYAVIYNGNGHTSGTPPIDPNRYRQTKTVTVRGPETMARAGYTFAGWNTATDGSAEMVQPGGTFPMGPAAQTFYAHWLPNNAINVVLDLPAAGSIEFSETLTMAKGGVLTVGVSNSFTTYQWFLNGEPIAGAMGHSVTLDTSGMEVGVHRVTVVTGSGGGTVSSGTCTVLVTN